VFCILHEWAALGVDQLGVLCCLWTGCVMEDCEWQSFQFGEAKFPAS
jgi:hypothetical protein